MRGPQEQAAPESMRLPYRTFTYGETYSRYSAVFFIKSGAVLAVANGLRMSSSVLHDRWRVRRHAIDTSHCTVLSTYI
jgi:hypothetical protein